MIGSAAYMFHWLDDATKFVRRHRTVLAERPVWLFSSGPLGTETTDDQGRDVREVSEPREIAELREAVHARDHRVFYGAYDPTSKPIGFGERLTRLLPAARDAFPAGDFRDWPEIDAWAEGIAHELAGVPTGSASNRSKQGSLYGRTALRPNRGVGMGPSRRSLLHAAVALLLGGVLIGCGSAAPTATSSPSPPTPSPTTFPATPSPSPTLPAGVAVLGTESAWAHIALSPDGAVLGAVALDRLSRTGSVRLFALDGRELASIPGDDFGWVDAGHLLVLVRGPDGLTGPVTLRTVKGSLTASLPGTWSGVLGNGHGSAVLRSAPPQGAYQGDYFQVWSNGRLGPLITGHGVPMAWSPDGTLLALNAYLGTVTRPGAVVLAATGGPIPGDLKLMRFPSAKEIYSLGLADLRVPLSFSRDGRYLAFGATSSLVSPVGLSVLTLATMTLRRIRALGDPLGWTPDGRLAISTPDGGSRLWSPNGELSDAGLPAGYPTYGPTMSDVAIVSVINSPAPNVIVRTAGGSLVVPVLASGPGFAPVWSLDGRVVFVDANSKDAQALDDRLLRVPAP